MRTIAALSLILVSSAAFAASPSPAVSGATYGGKPALTGEPLTLANAIKPENLGHAVRVQGTASAVCQKKGCWLTLGEADQSVRVSFKDYAFFVPKDLAGKTVLVEGTLSEETTDAKTAQHYAADAGKSKAEIEKITATREITMVATSVVVK